MLSQWHNFVQHAVTYDTNHCTTRVALTQNIVQLAVALTQLCTTRRFPDYFVKLADALTQAIVQLAETLTQNIVQLAVALTQLRKTHQHTDNFVQLVETMTQNIVLHAVTLTQLCTTRLRADTKLCTTRRLADTKHKPSRGHNFLQHAFVLNHHRIYITYKNCQ